MADESETRISGVTIAQVASIAFMWVFFLSISIWILNLLALSFELQDSFEATIVIGLIAVPVYLTLACILTYVFFGLRREEQRLLRQQPDE